ncbi:MAG: hypothetical protein M0R03_12110 [Novosphingobium sp.]|nr:hypothetical protein [Novosphingobium sp.]
MTDVALSLMVLTIFALTGGAWLLNRRGGSRRQVVLMLVLAGVVAMNVAIMVWPDSRGASPLLEAPR